MFDQNVGSSPAIAIQIGPSTDDIWLKFASLGSLFDNGCGNNLRFAPFRVLRCSLFEGHFSITARTLVVEFL